jgi:hypothetical protein
VEKLALFIVKFFFLVEIKVTFQGSADGMAVYFNMSSNYTVSGRGVKSIVIKSSGSEKI